MEKIQDIIFLLVFTWDLEAHHQVVSLKVCTMTGIQERHLSEGYGRTLQRFEAQGHQFPKNQSNRRIS